VLCELRPAALLLTQKADLRYGLRERGSDLRLDVEIDVAREVAVALADQGADMRAALAEDSCADIDRVLSREQRSGRVRTESGHRVVVID
jgi:hypothetical protein